MNGTSGRLSEEDLMRMAKAQRESSTFGSPSKMRGSGEETVSPVMSDNVYDETQIEGNDDSMRTQQLTVDSIGQSKSSGAGQGTNEKDMAAGVMMSSGNPYAMAAGLGLKVLSAKEKREAADAEARYNAKLDQIQRTQSALNNLVNVSGNLRL